MGMATYTVVQKHMTEALPDGIYGIHDGEGPRIGAHLYFSYEDATCENRKFGHFDLLVPGYGPFWFADSAPWLYTKGVFFVICLLV